MSEIQKKYYSLGLDKIKKINKITGNIYIEDKCNVMPKDHTIFQVKTKEKIQEIQIDVNCDSFYSSNFIEANRIKSYIKFILGIIQSKSEIKSSPISDIIYM